MSGLPSWPADYRSRIKGITVEIGGDTTGLDKALKSVNSSIKTTQSGLKDVSKLLKLDPTNTELLTQKQKLLKDAIGSTKEKLDALKLAQEQAKAQLESGDLGQDKYDALQREIIETEQELKRLQEQAIESNAALANKEIHPSGCISLFFTGEIRRISCNTPVGC